MWHVNRGSIKHCMGKLQSSIYTKPKSLRFLSGYLVVPGAGMDDDDVRDAVLVGATGGAVQLVFAAG